MSDPACGQFRDVHRYSRRRMLSIGAAAAIGLTLPDFLRLRAPVDAAPPTRGTGGSFGSAKKVIFIFLHGGHPQHETWDPKPAAPAEVRGEFGAIQTSVTGVAFSELFPRCAALADRLALVRTMSHDDANHVQACLPAMTGHKHLPAARALGDFPPSEGDFPHFGAVLDHLRPVSGELPAWVQLGPLMTRNNGTVLHGQSPGFLGRRHAPLVVDQDLLATDLRIQAVSPRIDVMRLEGRQRLLAEVDSQRAGLEQAAASIKDAFYRRAYGLLTSQATRRAFDLAEEPDAVRKLYPRTQVGQSCLLARRLVESGVPFVNVHWCKTPVESWDTHGDNFKKMKGSLGPNLDQSLAALMTDLEQRGLLDEVLVVPMAEFGRTPQINRAAGRDHWPFVYSLALAGAGLRRGVVEGRSDRLGAYPETAPYAPADMAATIYHLLGIPTDTTLRDATGRPHRLLVGQPINSLLT